MRKIIQRRIRQREDGVDLAADVNAAVAANVGSDATSTRVSSRQRAVLSSPGRTDEGGGADEPRAERAQ